MLSERIAAGIGEDLDEVAFVARTLGIDGAVLHVLAQANHGDGEQTTETGVDPAWCDNTSRSEELAGLASRCEERNAPAPEASTKNKASAGSWRMSMEKT